MIGLALFAHRHTAAHRAVAEHGEDLAVRLALFQHHGNDLGDDVASAAHDHGVAHAHIFAARFHLVVQRGVGDGHAAHKHGREFGHGREFAGATDLHINRLHRGACFLGGVFVRHGPARLAADKAQGALQHQIVDLVDHAVDVVGQLLTRPTDALVKGHQTGRAVGQGGLFGHWEAPGLQAHQHLHVLRGGVTAPLHLAQPIRKKAQGALRGNARIELAHRTGCGIARVDKGFVPGSGLACVERVEVRAGHVNLAAHLQDRGHIGTQQTQRDLPDGAHIGGDVFAALAITARGGLHQDASFVAQAHGQTIELELGDVAHGRRVGLQAQFFADARIKGLGSTGLHIGFGADAEHGHGVGDAGKTVQHPSTHALGGRVGCEPFGVRRFQALQFLEPRVVLGVADLGCVQGVVQVGVVVQPLAQLRHALGVSGRVAGRKQIGLTARGHGQANRRRAWSEPAERSRAASSS